MLRCPTRLCTFVGFALLLVGRFANLTVKNCVGVRIDVFFESKAQVFGMHLDSNTVQQCSGNCYSLGGRGESRAALPISCSPLVPLVLSPRASMACVCPQTAAHRPTWPGGVDLLMENSVFLRDMSTRLFMYGGRSSTRMTPHPPRGRICHLPSL